MKRILIAICIVLFTVGLVFANPVTIKHSQGVKVTLDPSTDPRATGHTLYVTDTNSGEIYTKSKPLGTNVFEYPAGSFHPDKTYTIYATAHDADGNESVPSDSVTVNVEKGTAPPPDRDMPIFTPPGKPIYLKIEVLTNDPIQE